MYQTWPVLKSLWLYRKWHFLQINVLKSDVPNVACTELDVTPFEAVWCYCLSETYKYLDTDKVVMLNSSDEATKL